MNHLTKLIRIGLDFHGVITDNPSYFKDFCDGALSRGWEVHIITGGPRAKVAAQLQEWGIRYSCLFAIFDFYKRKGQAEIYANGEFKIDKQLWDTAKSKYCRRNNITLQIDDSKVYQQGFSTPYCYYDAGAKHCTTGSGFRLDLSQPPAEVLDLIASHLEQI